MEVLINALVTNYGIFGVATVGLCGYILKIQGTHSTERKEFSEERKVFNAQHQKNFDMLLEVTNKNTEANTGLKEVIETFVRRQKKEN